MTSIIDDSAPSSTVSPDAPPEANASPKELLVGEESDITPLVSVVMPTLNEERGISTCIEWVKETIEEIQVPTEIIVSDSSSDWTPVIARELGAIVVTPDRIGYGYAYRFAFERARGQYIVMGDADTTYDFTQIPRLLNHLVKTGADIVMGSRLKGEIRGGAMPKLHQYVGNPLLTRFLNTFYKAGISDAHSGFRVFTRAALETIDPKTDGMEFASEMIMKAGAEGLHIEEIPIVYHERIGEEKLESFRDGWRHVRFMLVNAPTYLFSIPSLLLIVVGIGLITGFATGTSVANAQFGTGSLIAGGLFMNAGVQVGLFGLLAGIAGDPIQPPTDPISKFMSRNFSLERGSVTGLCLFTIGTVYTSWLIVQWIVSGYRAFTLDVTILIALLAIVGGVEIIFSSFFLKLIE